LIRFHFSFFSFFFSKHFFTVGQTFVYSVDGVNLKFRVIGIQTSTAEALIEGKASAATAAPGTSEFGCLMKGTQISVQLQMEVF